jgi:hypothetical protein
MAQGSTQPVTEIITRVISWGVGGSKGGRCLRPTTLPRLCADCLEILGTPNFWSPKDMSKTVMKQFLYYFIFKNMVIILPHSSVQRQEFL